MLKPQYWIFIAIFCVFYAVIAFWPSGALGLVSQFGVFFLLGLLGALVANSTGAGGGVVFIPFFTALGLSSPEAVATSMSIQCCGMSAGAIAWLSQAQRLPVSFHCEPVLFKRIIIGAGLSTSAGVLFAQYGLAKPDWEVAEIFRWFSIVFGLVLFFYALMTRNAIAKHKSSLSHAAFASILITGFLGGIITAWLSVGVGECLALLLFFLGFSAKFAVALGVITSCISVTTGIIYHLMVTQAVVWEVFLFAGQAALIGGFLAKHITLWLGGLRLKLFFAVWIFLSGLFIG